MSCPVDHTAGKAHSAGPEVGQGEEVPIPQPPPSWLTGNLGEIDPSDGPASFARLAEIYGDIYQLKLAGRTFIIVSSQEMVNEACNQDRFFKEPSRLLQEVRALTGDGLFTSAHEDGNTMKREENWWKAHRLLVPPFGPLGLRKMFDDMQDISAQLVLRWDRLGEQHRTDTSDDFTRLAFDTIGLCCFGNRFNEFYSDEAHPFAKQMAAVLKASGRKGNRPAILDVLYRSEEKQRQENVRLMHELSHEIVAERKANPKPDAKDLLNLMLYAKDREIGETLTDQNIVYNMATFLVAGHETTSGTDIACPPLLKNPDAFLKAQKQVDEVVGDRVVTADMIPQLDYLDACIKETLRLSNPIPPFTVIPRQETVLGGKYRIRKEDMVFVNLKGLHHDPRVWGDDHNLFKPERFLDGKFQVLPPNSWKPFGNGLRACIGRGFAEQEMVLNTAMVLQRFIPSMADPNYELRTKSTLTQKPEGFYMKMRRRPGKTLLTGIPGGLPSQIAQKQQAEHEQKITAAGPDQQTEKVKIFYGGNAGTCEGFAQALATSLNEHGLQAEIASLDTATEALSTETVNLIITSSYEGQPPDNAKSFVSWLQKLNAPALKDVKFTVMGVGNSDWATTFHRIPKLVVEKMQAAGATAIVPPAYTNVKADLMGPFEEWSEAVVKTLTSADTSATTTEQPAFKVSVERSKLARELGDERMRIGTVLKNDILADASIGLAKKHMEVRLPASMSYEAGDYFVIQPQNPPEAIYRVMRYFGYDEQTMIRIAGSRKKFLPSTLTAIDVFLRDHVELGTPVTKRQLKVIAGHAKDGTAVGLMSDEASAKFIDKWYTVIDVLVEHSITLPFDAYVDMLLPLTPRQHSISSSPLPQGQEDVASITYDLHRGLPALSGHGEFEGACSTYLSGRRVGDTISCFVRTTNVGFRLPGDPETPVIMFAAGTGIAPMRAFLQQRAAIAAGGARQLGPALLFIGTRDPEKDYLYKSGLEE